jgi:hypothetical protein
MRLSLQSARSPAHRYPDTPIAHACSCGFIALCLFPLCLFTATSRAGENLPHPTPVISPRMPAEVDAPVDPDANEIAVFDDYSWRAFIAINWPAKTAIRGVPDENKRFGDFSDPETKVVWATWKADYDLFQPGEADPTDWASFDGYTPCRDLPF